MDGYGDGRPLTRCGSAILIKFSKRPTQGAP